MRRGFFAGGLALLLVGILAAGCDYPTAPTGADDEELSHADPLDLAARATSPLIPPDLPPEIEGLPIAEQLRAVIVGFPEPEAVGICHTQVASRSRPVPFRVHRLEVDIPQEAWEEAQGRSVYLQYRRYAENGHVLRVARCVVPASMVAVDHLFDRFSLRGVRATASTSVSGAAGAWEVRPISTWPPHARRLTLTLRGTTVMAAEDGGEDDGCVDGNNDPEEEPEDPCEMDEIVVDGSECTNDDHERNEDGVCECSNGSDELDCYLEEEEEECDPLFEPECPNDDEGEPGGGKGSDPDDPDDCGSEDEICECGDERDVMIGEYEQREMNWTPTCADLATQSGSSHFTWPEYNGGWAGGNESRHEPYGYVTPVLINGMENTRANYDRGGIVISSGYRCPAGNTAIGSEYPTTSRHMFGDAADFYSLEHANTEQELELLRQAAVSAGATGTYWTMDPIHVHAQWN